LLFVVRQQLVRGEVTIIRRQNEPAEFLSTLFDNQGAVLKLCKDRVGRLHRLIRLWPAPLLRQLPGSCSDAQGSKMGLRVLLQPLRGSDSGIRFAGELPVPRGFGVTFLLSFCLSPSVLRMSSPAAPASVPRVDDPLLQDAGILRCMLCILVAAVGTRLQGEIGGVEGGIGDVVDLARVLQALGQLGDDRQQRLLIRLIPGGGLQEE
jgi:hypothetical protein